MPSEPVWIAAEVVRRINANEVARTGEPFFLRDEGLLESALARPRNHWSYGEEDMVRLAVALLLGIARNHPFEQGNKRTAFIAASFVLEANGYEIDPAVDSAEFADAIIQAIEKRIGDDELVGRFDEAVRPKGGGS